MKKKHLYEIDFMRSFIMLGVIAVHTMTIYNNQLTEDTQSFLVMSSVHSSMHVMRMVFMFITGFVLVLSNANREFKVIPFWRKRLFYSLIPYVFWNIIYLIFRGFYAIDFHGSILLFLKELGLSLIHGDQFYIYYVLVTLQFYIVFPLMYWLLNRYKNYHWQIFIYSFAFQLLLMTFYKFVIPQLDTTNWPYLLSHYGVFVLTYQCYFFAGGIVASHFNEILDFIEKHSKFLFTSVGLYIVVMWIHYYFNRFFLNEADHKAQLVHQPIYLPYTLLVVAIILLLGRKWSLVRLEKNWQPFSRYIDIASKTSFGIYLVQPFPIYIMKTFIMPYLVVNKWLFYLSLPFGILFVYFASMLIAYIFYKTPIVSYCIGRVSKLPKRVKSAQVYN